MAAVLRTCVVLPLLLWALLLPKVAIVLLDFHPHVQTLVICTGTEMVTLRIGPDGTPIEVDADEDAPCVVTEDEDVTVADSPKWVAFARDYRFAFVVTQSPLNNHNSDLLNRESQGPPLV